MSSHMDSISIADVMGRLEVCLEAHVEEAMERIGALIESRVTETMARIEHIEARVVHAKEQAAERTALQDVHALKEMEHATEKANIHRATEQLSQMAHVQNNPGDVDDDEETLSINGMNDAYVNDSGEKAATRAMEEADRLAVLADIAYGLENNGPDNLNQPRVSVFTHIYEGMDLRTSDLESATVTLKKLAKKDGIILASKTVTRSEGRRTRGIPILRRFEASPRHVPRGTTLKVFIAKKLRDESTSWKVTKIVEPQGVVVDGKEVRFTIGDALPAKVEQTIRDLYAKGEKSPEKLFASCVLPEFDADPSLKDWGLKEIRKLIQKVGFM